MAKGAAVTDGWDLFWSALVASFAGALAGCLVTLAVAWNSRRREARSGILTGGLVAVRDPLAELIRGLEKTGRPAPPPSVIGGAYSTVERDAITASATDHE